MTTAIEINFRELFEKLPADLQEVIGSENTAMAMDVISNKYQMGLGKEGNLSEETGLVLLGALHPKDFIADLSEKLGVERETAKKIAEDVNREIFQKVRVSLRKLYGITDDGEGIRNKPASPTGRELGITKEAPKPPQIPKPQPPPPKIVIKENIEPLRETPKEELKPLEIRPIKGGPLGEPEEGIRNNEVGIREAGVTGEERPAKTLPQTQHDAGLVVMPHSEMEIKKPASVPKPPPGLPFLEKKAEKKLEPPKPSYDQYRERI